MLMPSIFGENLFNDDWMDFSFPDVDKVLYGKHAKNVMKTYLMMTGWIFHFLMLTRCFMASMQRTL